MIKTRITLSLPKRLPPSPAEVRGGELNKRVDEQRPVLPQGRHRDSQESSELESEQHSPGRDLDSACGAAA